MRYLLLCLMIVIVSCGNKQAKQLTIDTTKGDAVTTVEADDEEINSAILAAKATLPLFEVALKQPKPNQERFGIKMKFEWGENSGEHMWLNQLFYKHDKLFGVLASDPQDVKGYKLGDTLEVDRSKMSDWSYIEDGYLKGGYTIKAMYNRLSDADKKQIEEEMGAKIE